MNVEDVAADVKARMTQKRIRRYSEPGRRSVRRPEEILRDVRGLKLRQRVSLVLGDEILKEELEDIIKNSTINGVTRSDTIRTFQDFLLPSLQPSLVSIGKGGGGAPTTVLPINDIRGQNTIDYSKAERAIRCKLASVYRLVDIMGWSEAIFNHISVRPYPDKEEFLLNPFGLLFNEVTASSLISCNVEGDILDGGSTSLGLNKAGYVLHSTIHEARPDIQCVIHVHTPTVVAVSSMKCGFLRISQESLLVGEVSYHDYWGILIDEAEKESIREDLGPTSMVMFLRNHGVVVCGKTIEDAFMMLNTVMDSCEAQIKAVSIGLDNLNIISDAAYNQVQEFVANASQNIIKSESGKPKLSMAVYYFEAYMRWLDSQGYRTGYTYHMPDIFVSGQPPKKYPESRVPPQVTSDRDAPYQVYYDYQQGNEKRRTQSMGRGNTYRNRVKWLNSPPVQGTQYVKEDPEETQKPESVPEEVINGYTNGFSNGHIEENESFTETVKGETKIVTKTTTVTETVVTDNSQEKVTLVNGSEVSTEAKVLNGDSSNVEINSADVDEQPVTSPNKSNSSLTLPSEAGSTPASTPAGDSPQKVKKSRSFKKTLMKKFNKKDEKKENEAK